MKRRAPEREPEIVLISSAAGCRGHGRSYLVGLARELAGQAAVAVVVPEDEALLAELATLDVAVRALPFDLGRSEADRFRRFGPAARVARGLFRMRDTAGFLHAALAPYRAPHGAPIVHVLDAEYLALGAALLRPLSARVVLTLHPGDFDRRDLGAAGLYKRLAAEVLRRLPIDAVVAHGNWIAERLRTHLGGGPHRPEIVAVEYPADAADRRIDRAAARRSLALPAHAKVLAFVGMIRTDKRLDVALRTLAALPAEYHLLIAGHPAELSADQVTSMIAELGLAGRTTTILRYLEDHEIDACLSAADALLATHDPRFASASGPVAMARSHRLPVVVSDVGQLGAEVRRFGTGAVAIAGDPSSFAAAVRSLLEHADRRNACVAAIERAAEACSFAAFGRAHAGLYRRLRARATEVPSPAPMQPERA